MFCPKCGTKNDDNAFRCVQCNEVIQIIQQPPAAAASASAWDDPAMKYVLPIGVSGWAIAAGYLGLFSVLVVFAPFAIIAGIIALRDIKENPKKSGKGRAIFGIAMGTICTLFPVVIFVIAAISK